MKRKQPPGRKAGELVHLYRGSPCVRSWSKEQKTVENWSLCGVFWGTRVEFWATEDPKRATCQFCRQLADLETAANAPRSRKVQSLGVR